MLVKEGKRCWPRRRWSWRGNKLIRSDSRGSNQEARVLLCAYTYIHVSKESWVSVTMEPQRQSLQWFYKSEPLEVDDRSIYLPGFHMICFRESCWCSELDRHGWALENRKTKAYRDAGCTQGNLQLLERSLLCYCVGIVMYVRTGVIMIWRAISLRN